MSSSLLNIILWLIIFFSLRIFGATKEEKPILNILTKSSDIFISNEATTTTPSPLSKNEKSNIITTPTISPHIIHARKIMQENEKAREAFENEMNPPIITSHDARAKFNESIRLIFGSSSDLYLELLFYFFAIISLFYLLYRSIVGNPTPKLPPSAESFRFSPTNNNPPADLPPLSCHHHPEVPPPTRFTNKKKNNNNSSTDAKFLSLENSIKRNYSNLFSTITHLGRELREEFQSCINEELLPSLERSSKTTQELIELKGQFQLHKNVVSSQLCEILKRLDTLSSSLSSDDHRDRRTHSSSPNGNLQNNDDNNTESPRNNHNNNARRVSFADQHIGNHPHLHSTPFRPHIPSSAFDETAILPPPPPLFNAGNHPEFNATTFHSALNSPPPPLTSSLPETTTFVPEMTTFSKITQSLAKLTIPRFNPKLMTADKFLMELSTYMVKRGFSELDSLSHLTEVFKGDSKLELWWAAHKYLTTTWKDFCLSFKSFYGTIFNIDEARAKLFSKQQQIKENFLTFAYTTLVEYQAVEPEVTKETVMNFVIDHSHPSIRSSLLGSRRNFISFEDMIVLGLQLETTRDLNKPAEKPHKNSNDSSTTTTSSSSATSSNNNTTTSSTHNNRRRNNDNNRRNNNYNNNNRQNKKENDDTTITTTSTPSFNNNNKTKPQREPPGPCPKCKETGHWASACPNSPNTVFTINKVSSSSSSPSPPTKKSGNERKA